MRIRLVQIASPLSVMGPLTLASAYGSLRKKREAARAGRLASAGGVPGEWLLGGADSLGTGHLGGAGRSSAGLGNWPAAWRLGSGGHDRRAESHWHPALHGRGTEVWW